MRSGSLCTHAASQVCESGAAQSRKAKSGPANVNSSLPLQSAASTNIVYNGGPVMSNGLNVRSPEFACDLETARQTGHCLMRPVTFISTIRTLLVVSKPTCPCL